MPDKTQHDPSRGEFLAWLSGAFVFLGVLFNAIPLVGALVAKPFGAAAEQFVRVGPTSALKVGAPTSLTFVDVQQDAYLHQTVGRNVWAVKQPTGDIVVFSPICPHLGCQVAWETANNRFLCPCHTSIFNVEGKLLSGPSPRDLDVLPSKVVDGELLVMWQQFKLTTPEKTPIA